MAKSSLTMTVRIEGARETLRVFKDLPKEASKELRERSMVLAQSLATSAQSAARSDQSPQARLFAPTIKPRRDRVPVIVAGGSKRVGRRGVPTWAILFGAEFGSNSYPQFRKQHSGRDGGPLFQSVEREQDTIDREWNAAADEVIARFTAGGG